MDRRDFFRRSTLLPLACIPFTSKGLPEEIPQTRKSYDERSKYLEYTEQDFMRCKIILLNEGNRIWGPPISKVKLSHNTFHVNLYVEYKVKNEITVSAMRFVDKDNRMLFQSRPCGIVHKKRDDILHLNYTISLG